MKERFQLINKTLKKNKRIYGNRENLLAVRIRPNIRKIK